MAQVTEARKCCSLWPASPSPQTQVWLGWRRVNQAKQRFDFEEKGTLDTPLPSQPLIKPVNEGERVEPRSTASSDVSNFTSS